MCIGIPARIISIVDGLLPQATIDVAGQQRECCLAYVPEAEVGNYVLVQNGFAMSVLSAEDAAESLAVIEEHNVISEGLERPSSQ